MRTAELTELDQLYLHLDREDEPWSVPLEVHVDGALDGNFVVDTGVVEPRAAGCAFRAACARCGSRGRGGCRSGSRWARPRSTAGSSPPCATAGRCSIRTLPQRSGASTATCCCPP